MISSLHEQFQTICQWLQQIKGPAVRTTAILNICSYLTLYIGFITSQLLISDTDTIPTMSTNFSISKNQSNANNVEYIYVLCSLIREWWWLVVTCRFPAFTTINFFKISVQVINHYSPFTTSLFTIIYFLKSSECAEAGICDGSISGLFASLTLWISISRRGCLYPLLPAMMFLFGFCGPIWWPCGSQNDDWSGRAFYYPVACFFFFQSGIRLSRSLPLHPTHLCVL